MSSNTWISVGVGVLAAAVVIFSGGTATAALFAFSVGATATSMILGPGGEQQKSGLRPDEFQMNQSAEDITIPVIFGTSRVSANYIFVDFDNFEAKEIYQEEQGGKGGGGGEKQQVGFTYTVPMSYGICMGEIDRLRRVISSPGLDVWKAFADDGLDFPGGGAETFDLVYTKEQGDQTYKEGGTCVFYPGSATQGDGAATTDTNHRFFCWVDFASYTMTNSPAPRTLLFEIQRMPKVLDDNGDPIAGFTTRASFDDTKPEWHDANPAAVAWEILQNPVWGKGATMADLDVETFKSAATYYASKRIGISTAMGKTTLQEFMGRLRDIFGLWVWWDGSKMRCRCIWDRATAYTPRTRITAEDVVDSPQFSRPSLSATYNELRLEFTNRESNWSGEVATAMDLAHVETVGGVRTQTVDAAEIGTRRAAELIAHSMLRQMAYPGATCVLRLRRAYSGLQPGSFVELVWNEWRDTGTATTFWRVMSVVDDDQGSEGLTVTLSEDLYATARDGEVGEDWEDPNSSVDDDDPLQLSDLDEGNLFGDRPMGSLSPIVLLEPNSWAAQMSRQLLVMPTREKNYISGATLAWRRFSESATFPLGTGRAFPFTGTLLDAVPATGPRLSREAAHEFRIQMVYPIKGVAFEAATGLVQDAADHFAELTRSLQAILVIEGEIFRVGFAEVTAPGVVTVRTYLRAEHGSAIATHAIGAHACFFASFSTGLMTPIEAVPTSSKVVLTLKPNSSVASVTGEEVVDTVEAPEDGLGITLAGASVAPLAPELYSATRVGNTWTVKIRPRVWYAGAGYKADIQDDLQNYVTDLTTLSVRVAKNVGGADTVTVPAGTNFSTPPFAMPTSTSIDSLAWKPDDGSKTGGIITLVVTFDANPASLKIWGVRNAFASTTPLVVNQP